MQTASQFRDQRNDDHEVVSLCLATDVFRADDGDSTLLELAQTAIDAIKDRRGQCSTSQAELSMAEADARQKWTQVLEMKAP